MRRKRPSARGRGVCVPAKTFLKTFVEFNCGIDGYTEVDSVFVSTYFRTSILGYVTACLHETYYVTSCLISNYVCN